MRTQAEKIKEIVYGLALGESLASPSADHRVALLAPKRIMRMRTLKEYADNLLQTTTPTPYTHAQPGYLLNPSPSDDSEWFVFTAQALMSSSTSIEDSWITLSKKRDLIRGRTGTKIALRNLDQGSSPAHSGHDNPHYFDDIASVRAVVAGILSKGSVSRAVELATKDARITHSEDGIWCAQAIAALVASLLGGSSKEDAVAVAMQQFPEGAWSARVIEKALNVAKGDASAISRALKLEQECVDRIYSYGISAPETLSLLFAHILNAQSAQELVLSTYLHKRNLDALPALAGAVAGLVFNESWIPKHFLDAPLLLDGVCIPDLKGTDLGVISTQLANAS
ncbi:MAG: ADP-ribosylglycohydrolase family protein [Actinobacteria bacterium]|nr:ADP-ribosylglycohydrolase family protein [Actinomycetota bacterium]